MGHLEDEDEPEEQDRHESCVECRRFHGMRAEEIAEFLGDVLKRHSRFPLTDK